MNKEGAIAIIEATIKNDGVISPKLKEALKVVLEDNSNNNNQVFCHECKYRKKNPNGRCMYICTYWDKPVSGIEYCSHAIKEIEVSVEEAINLLSARRNCNDCKAHFDSNCAACGLDVFSSEEQDKLTKAYDMAIQALKFKDTTLDRINREIEGLKEIVEYRDYCDALSKIKWWMEADNENDDR
jgi:hypothetical protein